MKRIFYIKFLFTYTINMYVCLLCGIQIDDVTSFTVFLSYSSPFSMYENKAFEKSSSQKKRILHIHKIKMKIKKKKDEIRQSCKEPFMG